MRIAPENRAPDFRNLAAVLERKVPSRPTLFEYFLNDPLYTRLTGIQPVIGDLAQSVRLAKAYENAGYDYVQLMCPWTFPMVKQKDGTATVSINQGNAIRNRKDFDLYPWPDPVAYDYKYLDGLAEVLPKGMEIIIAGTDGILETAIELVGYDHLCMMLYEDKTLVSDIFQRIGEIYLKYYGRVITHPHIAAVISSDDWGFNTQTLLSPEHLRKLVFPWNRQVCALAHTHGKYVILHSCGFYETILEDIIDMGFDARHSYEDNIVPVEEAYESMQSRLAVLGGIDLDFLVRSTPDEIRVRARAMLDRSAGRGGYALGSGNSIPEYVPDENYFAMIRACLNNE